MPHRSSVAQPWRMQASRYRLESTACKDCKNVEFPPRPECSKCGSQNLIGVVLSGEGEVLSFTIIHTAPEGFEDSVPYVIGIIKLKEGMNITAQITGNHRDVKIGKKVRSVFRKLYEHGEDGLIHYGFKFELIDETPSLIKYSK